MAKLLANAKIGEWYRSFGGGPPFEVVAIDTDEEVIEIQYFDGAIEEIDFESWLEMELQVVAQPEDSSGAMDMDREDFGSEPELGAAEYRGNPLDDLDRLERGGLFE